MGSSGWLAAATFSVAQPHHSEPNQLPPSPPCQVMEYLPGGDMMTLLIRKEILPEDWARFYLAQVGPLACVCVAGCSVVQRGNGLGQCVGRAWRGHQRLVSCAPSQHLHILAGHPCCRPSLPPPTLAATLTLQPPLPPDGGGAGGDPCRGLHPPRHQARQPAAGRCRALQAQRLWAVQAGGCVHPARLCSRRRGGRVGGGSGRHAALPQPAVAGRAAAALAGGRAGRGGLAWWEGRLAVTARATLE